MDATLHWTAVNTMNMLAAWRLNRGAVQHLPFVADEGFRASFVVLEQRMAELARLVDQLANQGEKPWPREDVADLAQTVEEQAYAFAAQVGGEERVRPIFEARAGRQDEDNTTPGTDEMAMAYLRNQALEVAGLALSISTTLRDSSDGNDGKATPTPAERVRQKRERERRGLRHRISVSVYDGDLDLLRAFGCLPGYETGNRDAIARALESFLAGAYLTRPASTGVPLERRLLAQLGRIKDLHADKAEA
jgi:hypothetical protein